MDWYSGKLIATVFSWFLVVYNKNAVNEKKNEFAHKRVYYIYISCITRERRKKKLANGSFRGVTRVDIRRVCV